MRPCSNKKSSPPTCHKHRALLLFGKYPRTSDTDNGISGFITTVWDFQVSRLFLTIVLLTCALSHIDGTSLIDARHD